MSRRQAALFVLGDRVTALEDRSAEGKTLPVSGIVVAVQNTKHGQYLLLQNDKRGDGKTWVWGADMRHGDYAPGTESMLF